MKNNPSDTSKQPQNGLYGRIPLDLLPKIRDLSNLEAKVFMVLSMLANFKREPVGSVECLSISHLAKEVGIPRKSLQRALKRLIECDMVTQEEKTKCVMVTHYLRHDDAAVRHGDAVGATPRRSKQPQLPIESTSSKAPIRSEEVSEEESEEEGGRTPPLLPFVSKKKKSKSAPKEKRVSATAHLLRFNGKNGSESEFEGPGRQRFREKIYERYEKDLGKEWIDATFNSCIEWCEDNPEKIEASKDHYLFLLGWFRREAKKDRERKER